VRAPANVRKTYVKLKKVVSKVKTMEQVIILEKPALTLEETILEKVKTLSPEKQQQVLDFIEFLQMKVKLQKKKFHFSTRLRNLLVVSMEAQAT
jgi:uncharacterized protein YecA (UPF0149 family)